MLMALGSLVLLTLLLGCLAVEADECVSRGAPKQATRRDRVQLFCYGPCTTFGQGAELYFSGIV